MSFKAIYTDKNGNKEFIKIPWYAAFGGTPRTKPKEKTCITCQGSGVVTCTRCGGKGRHLASSPGDKSTGAQQYSAHDKEEYSKADNKKIIQMKKENKAWKDILQAIGKQSKSQLQEHYKKNLQDKVDGAADNSGGDAKNSGTGFSNHPKEVYSKKDDTTIIQMKAAGKDWKEILQAIGKQSKSQLQTHWKDDLQTRVEQSGGRGGKSSSQASTHDDDYWEKMAGEHLHTTGERISGKEAKQRYGDD